MSRVTTSISVRASCQATGVKPPVRDSRGSGNQSSPEKASKGGLPPRGLPKEESHAGEARRGNGDQAHSSSIPTNSSCGSKPRSWGVLLVSPHGLALPPQTPSHPRAGSARTVVRVLFTSMQRARLWVSGGRYTCRSEDNKVLQTDTEKDREKQLPREAKRAKGYVQGRRAPSGFTLWRGPARRVAATGESCCRGAGMPGPEVAPEPGRPPVRAEGQEGPNPEGL